MAGCAGGGVNGAAAFAASLGADLTAGLAPAVVAGLDAVAFGAADFTGVVTGVGAVFLGQRGQGLAGQGEHVGRQVRRDETPAWTQPCQLRQFAAGGLSLHAAATNGVNNGLSFRFREPLASLAPAAVVGRELAGTVLRDTDVEALDRAGGLDPLLALTKADLGDPAPFLANYADLDVPHSVTSAHELSDAQRDELIASGGRVARDLDGGRVARLGGYRP